MILSMCTICIMGVIVNISIEVRNNGIVSKYIVIERVLSLWMRSHKSVEGSS